MVMVPSDLPSFFATLAGMMVSPTFCDGGNKTSKSPATGIGSGTADDPSVGQAANRAINDITAPSKTDFFNFFIIPP